MCKHGTKTIQVLLPADGEASWSLFPSLVSLLSGSTTVTIRKHLFLYPHGIPSNQIAQNERFIVNPVYPGGGTLAAKISYLDSLKV